MYKPRMLFSSKYITKLFNVIRCSQDVLLIFVFSFFFLHFENVK